MMNGVEIYSVDASHHNLLPLAVVNPMDIYMTYEKFVKTGSLIICLSQQEEQEQVFSDNLYLMVY
jgi:hypothetical protein